jgi:radical SAM enzyme (TIGR01210 family)
VEWPSTALARDRLVVGQRPARAPHDPWRAQGLLVEEEPDGGGTLTAVATLFLTGRECPWRCAMCDLWMHTTEADTPVGAIAAQVAVACRELGTRPVPPSVIKLYNAGSFFDPRAVPVADYDDIAGSLQRFTRVIVESHPALIGARTDQFIDALRRRAGGDKAPPALEVAMGLETAHPEALEQLNKRMDVPAFTGAAEQLRARGIALRTFLLISPPFVPRGEQASWLLRSIDVALACGASVISLVPTRRGNGTLERLEQAGAFREPTLDEIEAETIAALTHVAGRARLLVDLWDIGRFGSDPDGSRVRRLHALNLQQRATGTT